MKIRRVNIHNWRSIRDVEIDFRDLMVIIGQNNHGKSNVLSSLLFFFGEISCSEHDFTRGTEELYVEVLFSDLDEDDKRQFAKYLTIEGTITVRKRVVGKNAAAEYRGYCQIPEEDCLKEERISEFNKKELHDTLPFKSLLPDKGRITKETFLKAQRDYVAQNLETVRLNYELEETPFMGERNVAQGIFGQVFFVPAVKNAMEEFSSKGKSIFSQLLTNVINEMSSHNEIYRDVKDRVRNLTEKLNKKISDGTLNSDRPEQISELEKGLESELANWNTKIDIEITPPNVDDVLRLGTNVWIDDGVPTDVNRKGHGLQRALIFALIKAWAKVTKSQREKAHEATEEGEGEEYRASRKVSESTYFIFEEPELYLHPQAQRELYDSLKQLSNAGNQVVLSTHSSSFIELEGYKSICIISKDDLASGSKSRQCKEELFSAGEEKASFDISYWINPDRGELFFAKKVILFEGQTEKVVVPCLAKKLGLYRYDYTAIDCASKDNIPKYIKLLNKFKLPYVAVYDKDHQAYKNDDARKESDRKSKLIDDVIDSGFGSAVVMHNDIEEELGVECRGSKSKPQFAFECVSSPKYVIPEGLKSKIAQIYS